MNNNDCRISSAYNTQRYQRLDFKEKLSKQDCNQVNLRLKTLALSGCSGPWLRCRQVALLVGEAGAGASKSNRAPTYRGPFASQGEVDAEVPFAMLARVASHLRKPRAWHEMLAEVIHLFSRASIVARFTECSMPKSSAWMTSKRELAG